MLFTSAPAPKKQARRFPPSSYQRWLSSTITNFNEKHKDIYEMLWILTLYYSTVGLLKPTLVTNSNYLNLVRYKNLKFPDFSCLFFPITMKLFLFIQHKRFKRKMRVFDKFFKILPISSFRCKILILRIIFLVEIKRIRVNWCPRLDGLQ